MAFIGLLVLVLGACGQVEEAASPALTPGYEPADCQFTLSGSPEVECGYLVVPEDRTQPDGRMDWLEVQLETVLSDPRYLWEGMHISTAPEEAVDTGCPESLK